MIVRELLTKWKIVTDDKALDRSNKKIKDTQQSLKKMAQTSVRVGKTLTAFVTLPILGIGAAFIKAASDAEETTAKFETIFRDMRSESNETAKTFARDFGLSSTKSKELLGNTADLLTGFKFEQKAALDLSKSVNELAVDLASFTNFSGGAEGASKALTKALLGERESVKSLGISILEEDVKAKVKQLKASGELTNQTERQAKALATLRIAQEQSANAIGDFARTSTSFANRLRILRGRINDMAVSFGKILLPTATKLLEKVTTLFEGFENLSEGTKKFILIAGGILALLGPILLIVGSLGLAITGITGAMSAFGVASFAALLPILVNFLLIAAAVTAVFLIAEDLFAFFRGDVSFIGKLIDDFTKKFPRLAEVLAAVAGLIKEEFLLLVEVMKFVFNTIMSVGQAVMDFLSPIGDFIGGILSKLGNSGVFKALSGFIAGKAEDVRGARESLAAVNEAPAAAPATSGGAVSNNINLNMSSPISVPPGTPPEAVQSGVREGVADVLGGMLRNASTANSSPISF